MPLEPVGNPPSTICFPSVTNHIVAGGSAAIFPSLNLTDTSGNPIQAHGGGIIQDSGYFYWFGEDKTGETTSGHFQAVNCYRSTDFASWEFRGAVLTPIANTNISSASIVERPKVLYNAKNSEYVMWFHNDDFSYSAAMVGVATSPTIDGPYTWKGSFKPLGTDSRDMTVWQDPTNSSAAYLIFASDDNANLKIASLSPDFYTATSQLFIWEDVYWEAPGILKIADTFYLLYSRQDGWTPTDNYYMSAPSLSGPWSEPSLLAPNGTFAFNTQNAYDLTITGSQGTTYLYYGDHWNAPNLGASAYAFYPITHNPSAGTLASVGTPAWTLTPFLGTWSNLTSTSIPAADFTASPPSALVDCAACEGGKTANLTSSSNSSVSFTYNGPPGPKVLSLSYVFDAGKQVWRTARIDVDGEVVDVLLESTRGTETYLAAPARVSVGGGSEVTVKLVGGGEDGDGEVLVEGVDVFDA
ncbi:MAG: hypothetical protein Q9160_007711 [Pyrenula sp. 1 TL-2023]